MLHLFVRMDPTSLRNLIKVVFANKKKLGKSVSNKKFRYLENQVAHITALGLVVITLLPFSDNLVV